MAASVEDWILVDAWHRSRRLELPDGEEAMVACLELVNHSSRPSAYYEVEPDGDLALFMRPGCRGSQGQELTISYGEAKSAAEMLFSYGFIDGEGATRELRLHLDPLPDDPLAKAKIAVLKARPTLRLSLKSGDLGEGREVRWECPSIELLCLNEEDGLSFQLAQDEAGERHLRLFWRGEDVTETEGELGALVQGCDLAEVLRLRAISLLQDRVEWQLARLKGSPSSPERPPTLEASQGRWEACLELASALKRVEREILERTAEVLEKEVREEVESSDPIPGAMMMMVTRYFFVLFIFLFLLPQHSLSLFAGEAFSSFVFLRLSLRKAPPPPSFSPFLVLARRLFEVAPRQRNS